MTYDLHMHSHFSDGDLSPTELVALAKEMGVTVMSLTDHDTMAGLEQAQAQASQQGVSFINGVELSCTWDKYLLHIVGLNVDSSDDQLTFGIQENLNRRKQRAQAMIENLAKHGIDIADEVAKQIGDQAAPTRPHFAQALINLGKVKNKNQAFKQYLTKGKPGFVPMQWPSLEELATWINEAGGVGVLAHPLRYKMTRFKLNKLVSEMKEAGIRGIEVSTGNTDMQQISTVSNLALEHKLYASMGSDFHSPSQPWARLGSAKPLPSSLTPIWELF